jgi:hypothetical protein
MPLSFLTEDANQELVLRLQRACAPERKQHVAEQQKLLQDCTARGVRQSGFYTKNLIDMELDFAARLARITRDEIFALVEAENLRLNKSDVAAISDEVGRALGPTFRTLESHVEAEAKHSGRSVRIKEALGHKIEYVLAHESRAEVILCDSILSRKQKASRRKWWLDRVEKLVWLVAGVLLGVAGTLLTQWLVKPPNP